MGKHLAIALSAAVMLLVFAASAPAVSYKSCGGGFNPDGSAGSFYKKIRAKGLGCPAAKAVTKAWVKYEASRDGANPTAKVKVKGYSCSGKSIKSSGDGAALAVLCVKGKSAIRFTGSP